MGEAKRRKSGFSLKTIPGYSLRPNVDIDDAIKHVEDLVENDKVEGFVTIAKTKPIAGIAKVEMLTLGIDKKDAFEMLCICRDMYDEAFGLKEFEEPTDEDIALFHGDLDELCELAGVSTTAQHVPMSPHETFQLALTKLKETRGTAEVVTSMSLSTAYSSAEALIAANSEQVLMALAYTLTGGRMPPDVALDAIQFLKAEIATQKKDS